MLRNFLMVLLLSLGGGPALADWVRIAQTEQSAFYLETPMAKKSGEHVMIWVLRDHLAPQYGSSGPFLSSKDHMEVDCAARRIRRLYLGEHALAMGQGKQIRFEHGPMSWNHAQPGTVLRRIADVACGQP